MTGRRLQLDVPDSDDSRVPDCQWDDHWQSESLDLSPRSEPEQI